MPQTDVAIAFQAAAAADVATMSRDQLNEHLARLRVVRSWADAAEIAANRRARELAEAGHAGSAEAAHVRAGQRSEREARAVTDRAEVCTQMPGFEAALAAGSVSAGHVDAVARAAGKLDDTGRERLAAAAEQYVDQAARSSVDAFDRAMRKEAAAINAATAGVTAADELAAQRRRSGVKRWVDQVTGMHHTNIELDPVRDAEMWTAIEQQLATDRAADGNANTAWSELRVQAVVNAAKSAGGATRRPEVNVIIDYRTLAGAATIGGVCETLDGTPLPASEVRRMCCDADVFPTVLGGPSEVLDVGRAQRTATPTQRRALAALHRTCGHPECTVPFSATRIHHIRFWTEHHGPTDLDNLLPLCARHHHQIHDDGWTLTMTTDRHTTWTRPDGSIHATRTTVDRPRPALDPTSPLPGSRECQRHALPESPAATM